MKLFRRELYLSKIRGFYDAADLIKVITGLRRCGKSSLMKTIVDELKEQGVSDENIIFLDLDSREYLKIRSAKALDKLIQSVSKAKGLKYLFIDEIQNVANFEEVVNAYRDSDFSIFITGSNSYLLSGELVTKLTGRYIEFEIFTLTFAEYVAMKRFYNLSVASLDEEFNQFILEGGFPRTVLFERLEDKRLYTQSVVHEILEKDIKSRVRIRNLSVFERVRDYIFNNFGAITSMTNILAHFNVTERVPLLRSTLIRYLQILEDAKIIYRCNRFDMKSKRSLGGDQKYYIADLSFYFARNTDNRVNYGPVLENLVYFYARSLGYSVSVGRIGRVYECDFIVRDINMKYAYIQVSYDTSSEKTQEREYRPFQHIKDNWPKYLLTMDRLFQKNDAVHHLDIVKFLYNQSRF